MPVPPVPSGNPTAYFSTRGLIVDKREVGSSEEMLRICARMETGKLDQVLRLDPGEGLLALVQGLTKDGAVLFGSRDFGTDSNSVAASWWILSHFPKLL